MKRELPSDCNGCDTQERWLLHDIRERSEYRRLCTSCVLKVHAGLFCPNCFEVYERSQLPIDKLVCARCPSVSHANCVAKDSQLNWVCPTCSNPNFMFFEPNLNGNHRCLVDAKKARVLVAATKLAALSMCKAAIFARVEADRRAKEAALARKKAKEALQQASFLPTKVKEKGKSSNAQFKSLVNGFEQGQSSVSGIGVEKSKSYVNGVEHQTKKSKGNGGIVASAGAEKPVETSLRNVGNASSGSAMLSATNASSVVAEKPIENSNRNVGNASSGSAMLSATNAGSVVAQKQIVNSNRNVGNASSGSGMMTLSNAGSSGRVPAPNTPQNNGVSVGITDKLQGSSVSVSVTGRQQLQNSVTLMKGKDSGNLPHLDTEKNAKGSSDLPHLEKDKNSKGSSNLPYLDKEKNGSLSVASATSGVIKIENPNNMARLQQVSTQEKPGILSVAPAVGALHDIQNSPVIEDGRGESMGLGESLTGPQISSPNQVASSVKVKDEYPLAGSSNTAN
ncbi:hypothetical protein GIB67_029792 [Kingdonia uniflora]|uniref:Uncharacterized protein n=1 Tax=Kingdonia uniflora TaxID=39325 RepID=A0A7J7NJK2_9MAGN|nr:hypothetical protein GIB67_029792 [Kingdonia uniflora]